MNTTNRLLAYRGTRRRHRQQGAVLVVGLMFLLIMTLLGVSSMNTSNLEERMAGNLRDRDIAFQAAESALREGERVVADNAAALTFDTNCTNGLCDCDTATTCAEYWTDPSLDVWNTATRHTEYKTNIANVAATAQYIIEDLGTYDVVDAVCPHPGCPRDYYRVTARGMGMTPNTVVMLQSTYRID